MRPFEKVLIALLLITFLANMLLEAALAGWLNFSLLNLLALMLVLHLAVERSRWQMGPLYLLALLTLVFMAGRSANPALGTSPWVSAAGLGLLALFSLPPLLIPVPLPPKPSGPNAVGTLTFEWVDETRPEIYDPNPGARRRIMVQAWYPAERPAGRSRLAPYFDHPAERTGREILSRRLPAFLFRYLDLGRTHSYPEAPVTKAPGAFPVLVFSHGWRGYRSQNNFQVEELASRGYVVFSADHTYGATATIFPDGTVIYLKPDALPANVSEGEYDRAARLLGQTWVGDIRFILDQAARIQSGQIQAPFSGKLDLERVGVLGHSTGGGAAVEACWLDQRCKAGLAMDAWLIPYDRQIPNEGLRQPFLFMQSENWPIPRNAPLAAALFANMQACAYRLTIRGARHPDFAELPLLTPLLSLTGFRGRIGARQQMRIVNAYTLAFFDHFLKGQPVSPPLLEGPMAAAEFPQVNLEINSSHCET
jgi:predicted dienelactone hydrolase